MANQRHSLIPKSIFDFPTTFFSSFFPRSWEDLEGRMTQWMENTGVTVSEDDQSVYVEAEMPGLNQEDIDITIHHGNTLVIQGKKEEEENKERRIYRRGRRSFYYYEVMLPTPVDEQNEQAQYQNGILAITFRKTTGGDIRKISIGGRSQQQQQIQQQQRNQGQQQKKQRSS